MTREDLLKLIGQLIAVMDERDRYRETLEHIIDGLEACGGFKASIAEIQKVLDGERDFIEVRIATKENRDMEGHPIMEEVMSEIRNNLKPGTSAYNSTWNAIEKWHNRHIHESTRPNPEKATS